MVSAANITAAAKHSANENFAMSVKANSKLIHLPDVAEMLNVSVRTLNRWITEGVGGHKLASIKIVAKSYTTWEDIQEFSRATSGETDGEQQASNESAREAGRVIAKIQKNGQPSKSASKTAKNNDQEIQLPRTNEEAIEHLRVHHGIVVKPEGGVIDCYAAKS